MSLGEVIFVDSSSIAKLQSVLVRHRDELHKSGEKVIAKEAHEWRLALYKEFKKTSPKPSKIISAARGRGYKIRRNDNGLVMTERGVSKAAAAYSDSLLGGHPSDYFRVEESENGVFIKPVRFSKTGKKLLRGGSTGRKFSDSALTSRQVDPEAGSQIIEQAVAMDPTLKKMNRRAVDVASELGMRSRAAKGGTMSMQWLGSHFSNRDSSTVKRGEQVMRTSKGIPIGLVAFAGLQDSFSVTLSGFVPGTAKQAARHGIVGHVAAIRIADRMQYLQEQIEKAKQKALSL